MIYCPQCGNPNFDDANYCDTCGEPLISADEYAKMKNAAEMQQLLEAQRQQREAAAYNKAYRKAQKEAKKAAKSQDKSVGASTQDQSVGADTARTETPGSGSQDKCVGVGTARTNTPGSGPQAPEATPADFTVYKHGCLAQAWDDITESPSWAKRLILLGLVNMVPILNFFVTGYAMQWARQLPLDQVQVMPNKIFRDGAFKLGFFAFVIALVVGVIAGIVSGIAGLLPFVGVIIGAAVSLFCMMVQIVSIMRVAVSENLASGFDVKTIWKIIFTNRFGKLFCATLLPGIIVGAATAFVCGSVLVIFGVNSISSLVENIQYAQQMEQYAQLAQSNPFMMMMDPTLSMYSMGVNPWDAVFSQMVSLVPLFFVVYLISMFLMSLGTVLTYRATAHYTTRYAHESVL